MEGKREFCMAGALRGRSKDKIYGQRLMNFSTYVLSWEGEISLERSNVGTLSSTFADMFTRRHVF
jgi:hypothetical protein